jgi:hypothetical protein
MAFALAYWAEKRMFVLARTPRVRMFIEAEKKKLTREPNPQPPLPSQRLVR